MYLRQSHSEPKPRKLKKGKLTFMPFCCYTWRGVIVPLDCFISRLVQSIPFCITFLAENCTVHMLMLLLSGCIRLF